MVESSLREPDFGPVAHGAIGRDVHVVDRIGAIGERPEDRVGVARVDVLAHRDADLAAVGQQRGSAVQRAPDFGARHALRALHEQHLAQIGERLVHHHLAHALDRQPVAQVHQEHRLVGDLLDHARFARRDLADDGDEHRRALARDRGHLHRHVEVFERDVAVAFAERAFRLQQFGIDQAFDHDLGVRRHVEIDADAFRHADRRAGEPAGHRHLVEVDGELHRPGEHHHRRGADDEGAGHRRLQLVVLAPVLVAAGAADARRHAHAEPVGRLQAGAVGAHVLHAGFRIARDRERRGEIGRRVEAGRRDRHRQRREALAGPAQIVAGDHHLLARRRGDAHRRDRIVDGVGPGRFDVFDRLAHAERIDARRGGERADHHRHVVTFAGAVGDVGEQERAPLILGEPALELPAHQRMQLGVLVDRTIDARDQPLRFQRGEMLLEIQRRPLRHGGSARLVGHVEHCRSFCDFGGKLRLVAAVVMPAKAGIQ